MCVENVLRTDVFDVGKFIFCRDIPHFNKLDRIPIPAWNVHQNGREVTDTFAVTQLLFNFFFHFIRHTGIARVENAASMGAVVVIAAAENDGFTVKQGRVYAADIVGQPVNMLLRVVHLDKDDIFLRPYPELASGLHLPKLARVVAPSEAVKSGNFADPFRPRYAVDVQLLDADGNPDNQTPVYSAVPLPVPMAGNDSGMFQFPPEGTLVEVAFTGGRPDKPFIRQTLPDGTSLPDVKPGEQLQQQRAEVSQRVTQAGDWVRKTDQTISETSMARMVKADTEQRDLVSRETTVKATDKTMVLGTATLMAGAIQQVSAGDYSQAVKGNRLVSIEGNDETDIAGKQSTKVAGAVDVDVGGTLTEKIAALRKSVAAGGQQIMGPTVHIGSESVNTLTMMLDTIDLLAELAQQCASHSHPSVGTPTNAGAFTQTAERAGQTRSKYQKIIA
ncbi:Gp5 C-terminal repeat (3 copies) [Escherichia coli]|nr:Gp5 C-terminal repeat (3 copies) [Escherichia coli]